MLVISANHIQGISKKTGKPFDCVKVSGIGRNYDGSIDVQTFMVSPAEWERSGVAPGDSIRKFNDGGIFVDGLKVFDIHLFDGVV